MKKFLAVFLVLIFSSGSHAQEEKTTYLKGNITMLPLVILNFGREQQLTDKITWQTDILISPWRSVYGRRAQALMGTIEGRYYFKEAFDRFYVGANIGTSLFDITKWNYFYSGKHQVGFNYMLGGVVGYQFRWTDQWNVDIFIGGGLSEAQYKSYTTNEYGYKVRTDGAFGWNKSAEWIPYRGGIMLAYKLK